MQIRSFFITLDCNVLTLDVLDEFYIYDGPGCHCQHLTQMLSSSFQILIMTTSELRSRNHSVCFSSLYAPSQHSFGYTELNTSKLTTYHIKQLLASQDVEVMLTLKWIGWSGWTGRMCEYGFIAFSDSFYSGNNELPTTLKFGRFCGKHPSSDHHLLLDIHHYLHSGQIIVYNSHPYFSLSLGYNISVYEEASISLPLFGDIPMLSANIKMGLLNIIDKNDPSQKCYEYHVTWRQGTPFQLTFLPVCIPTIKAELNHITITDALFAQITYKTNWTVESGFRSSFDSSGSVSLRSRKVLGFLQYCQYYAVKNQS